MSEHSEYYRDLGHNLAELLGHMIPNTLVIEPGTGRFVRSDSCLEFQGPWLYTVPEPRACFRCHTILFDTLSMMPVRCLQCWKVVVSPRTLTELFALARLQDEMGHSSKCGMEPRNYVNRLYGGYFYNDSLPEGLDCWEKVREAVTDTISPDVPVILKRGCTEFERKCGPSDQWDDLVTQRDRDWQCRYFNNWVDAGDPEDNLIRPPFHLWVAWKNRCVRFAAANGDETWREYATDEDVEDADLEPLRKTVLFHDPCPGPVRYEPGSRE